MFFLFICVIMNVISIIVIINTNDIVIIILNNSSGRREGDWYCDSCNAH